MLSDTHSIYIATLGVITELRRFGIASILLEKAREYARGNPLTPLYMHLHVVDYNKSALMFYEKQGMIY